MGGEGSSDLFPKKFHPDQRLGRFHVVFPLQEMEAHVQAEDLRAIGVPDIKLLIFKPQT